MVFTNFQLNNINPFLGNLIINIFLCSDLAKQEPREEFSDWPHGLLAIGTFGNKSEIKADLDEKNTQEDQ